MVGGWFGPAMDHPRRTVKKNDEKKKAVA